MIKHIRITLKTALFFPILIWINSCQNVDKLKFSNYFFYNEDQNLTTLDPAFTRTQSEIWVASQMFEGLVEFNDQLESVPCLAKRWEISDSGKVYTFHLRTDVFFHPLAEIEPGEKLKSPAKKFKAEDVVFSFRRVADPKTASPGAWIFNDKMDLRCFSSNDSVPFPVVALNDSTVQITLLKAFKPFIGILSMNYCYIVPNGINTSEFRTHPIGTGPFMFRKWEDEVGVLLGRNPLYYRFENGQRLPYLDGVMVDNIKNKQTAFMKFVHGEYDFFNGIDATIKDELISRNGDLKEAYKGKFNLIKSPFMNTEYIGFNIDPKFDKHPLNNSDFRRAINFAIDKKKLILYLRNGIGIPAQYGFVPIGMPGYDFNKIQQQTYNIDSAIYYIKRSKVNLAEMPEIVLNTTQDYLELMIYVQKELQKVGIKMKIEVHPSSFLRQLKKDQKINCFRGSWTADYPDAENYLICFESRNFSPGGPNYFHYTNPLYDQLMQKTMVETNDAKRMTYLTQAENMMMRDMPCIILYYDESIRMSQKWVEGLTSNPNNFLRLRTVKKLKH